MSADLDPGRRAGLHLAPDFVEPLPRPDAHRAYRLAGDHRPRLAAVSIGRRPAGAHRRPVGRWRSR